MCIRDRYYSESLERLYESYVISSWGRSPFQGWAPGRAAQNHQIAWRGNFSEIWENPTFHENLYFLNHTKNLCFSTTFYKTHRQTQRIHSWIALDLIYIRKLLRSQLNSQILKYLHFSELSANFFDKPSWSRFPLRLYYSKSIERLYESYRISSVGRSPFQGWAPGRAAQNEQNARRDHFSKNSTKLDTVSYTHLTLPTIYSV